MAFVAPVGDRTELSTDDLIWTCRPLRVYGEVLAHLARRELLHNPQPHLIHGPAGRPRLSFERKHQRKPPVQAMKLMMK